MEEDIGSVGAKEAGGVPQVPEDEPMVEAEAVLGVPQVPEDEPLEAEGEEATVVKPVASSGFRGGDRSKWKKSRRLNPKTKHDKVTGKRKGKRVAVVAEPPAVEAEEEATVATVDHQPKGRRGRRPKKRVAVVEPVEAVEAEATVEHPSKRRSVRAPKKTATVEEPVEAEVRTGKTFWIHSGGVRTGKTFW